MNSQNDVSKKADRPNRCSYLLLSAIALLAVLNSDVSAFPTPGRQHHYLSTKGSTATNFVSHGSTNHAAFCSSYTGLKSYTKPPFSNYGCQSLSTTRSSAAAAMVALNARSNKDTEQEEFQRSLLEAKIANDIKGTTVKEENQRIEIVTKQIDQEKKDLKVAVKEVKEAVKGVSQSAKNLGGAVISNSTEVKEAAKDVSKSAVNLGGAFLTKGPGIFGRLFTLLATGELR